MTLRWLADVATEWEAGDLEGMAVAVGRESERACCPLCQEIGCDDDCPLVGARETNR